MERASRLPKFPDASAYTRAAFVEELLWIVVSLMVLFLVFSIKIAAAEGVRLFVAGFTSTQPIAVGALAPEVLKRRELRAGTE